MSTLKNHTPVSFSHPNGINDAKLARSTYLPQQVIHQTRPEVVNYSHHHPQYIQSPQVHYVNQPTTRIEHPQVGRPVSYSNPRVVYNQPLTYQPYVGNQPRGNQIRQAPIITQRRGSFAPSIAEPLSVMPSSRKEYKPQQLIVSRIQKVNSKELAPQTKNEIKKTLLGQLDKLGTKDKDRLLLNVDKELDAKGSSWCCGGDTRKNAKDLLVQRM